MTARTTEIEEMLAPLKALHDRMRDQVVAATERAAVDALADVHAEEEGDTIYAIDKIAEDVLVGEIDRAIARRHGPVVLVAEGLPGGRAILPRGAPAADARWTIIVDPIDGTRGLMYQKRPAWILTGVAPLRRGAPPHQAGRPHPLNQRDQPGEPSLADIVLALQTEIPLVKQHLCDQLWAFSGDGARGERLNRLTGARHALSLRPSTGTTLAHGFATVARFFPGVRAELAALDDEIVETLLGPPVPGKAQLFEDQYISTGGQLYELIVGHDRFVADLRSIARRRDTVDSPSVVPPPSRDARRQTSRPSPFAPRATADKSSFVLRPSSLCCHPYDLCTELIGRECGVIVTDEQGGPLSAPLDVDADVSWVGYANRALRTTVEPVLLQALRDRGWIA